MLHSHRTAHLIPSYYPVSNWSQLSTDDFSPSPLALSSSTSRPPFAAPQSWHVTPMRTHWTCAPYPSTPPSARVCAPPPPSSHATSPAGPRTERTSPAGSPSSPCTCQWLCSLEWAEGISLAGEVLGPRPGWKVQIHEVGGLRIASLREGLKSGSQALVLWSKISVRVQCTVVGFCRLPVLKAQFHS